MTKVPESLADLFYDFVSSVKDNDVLIGIAVDELSRLDKTIELVAAVGALQRHRGEDAGDADLRRLSGALPLVKAQHRKGFPFLHGLAAIAVWSELEAYVEDAAIELLFKRPATWSVDAIGKLKAPLSEFIQLTDRPRCEWVVQALQRDLAVGRRPGVAQFEPLLMALGVGGTVDSES